MNYHTTSTAPAARSATAPAARRTSRPVARPAARGARPSAANAPRRRVLMHTSLGLIEAIHGPDLTWPDGETTVEFVAAAVRAAG